MKYLHCIDTMEEDDKNIGDPVYLRLGDLFLNGESVKEDSLNALKCYQKAETFLSEMVMEGNYMYKKSLQAAIDGQAKARGKLTTQFPKQEWHHDD